MLVNMWLLILERIHFGTSHSHSFNTPSPVNVRLETSQPMKFEEVRIVQIWLERWEQVEVQSSIKCFASFAPINFDFIKRFTDGYVIRNKYIYIYIYIETNKLLNTHTWLHSLTKQEQTFDYGMNTIFTNIVCLQTTQRKWQHSHRRRHTSIVRGARYSILCTYNTFVISTTWNLDNFNRF